VTNIQFEIVLIFGILSFLILLKGTQETYIKKNPYGLVRPLIFWGVFVWGDAVIIGFFWSIISLFILFLKDWYLFLLVISVFWTIRSLGETFYWLNQQFTSVNNKNPVQNLKLGFLFHSDAVWFANQVIWQCVSVIFFILTLISSKLWLSGL
jgi:hypothetical protein